jgi:uncharacterized membrane protein YdbT with pleckstrin-like domain
VETGPGEHILYEGHPSWRSILGFYLKGLLIALVAGAVGLVASSAGVGAGVLGAFLVFVIVIGLIKRIATTYTITNHRLTIRRGVISRRVQQTRLERVQNVNTEQSVFDRVLQVGTVDFDTAGTTDSDFSFRGVSRPGKVMADVDKAQREHAADPTGLGGSPRQQQQVEPPPA